MRVVSIIGGLGSQMFKYAFYLALKEKCRDDVYIDTTCYLQRSYPYLLDSLFGLHAPDIKDILSTDQINEISQNKANYIDCCLREMLKHGECSYFILGKKYIYKHPPLPSFRIINQKYLYFLHKIGIRYSFQIDDVIDDENAYFNEYYHMSDNHFDFCKDRIVSAFHFPKFSDKQNLIVYEEITNSNSVAIHVRRTDYSSVSGKIIESGYYRKAVDYIRKNQSGMIYFYIFSDDFEWCRNNLDRLGLSSDDHIIYVDWNTGENSYKDMQLMSCCKHNILSNSAFSWWGYYLSTRSEKIVCAPENYWFNVEHHF